MEDKCEICGKEPIDPLDSQKRYWCFHCRKFYPFNMTQEQVDDYKKEKPDERTLQTLSRT